MRIKYFILISIMSLVNLTLSANEGRFHIYGKCSLVGDEEMEGFIRFDNDHLWVSQFIATKLDNPYAKLFANNSSVRFGENRNLQPSVHTFICRYNDIKKLRPIAENQLEVTIKGDRAIDVSYKFANKPTIYMLDGTSKELEWSEIATIQFMSSPNTVPSNFEKLYVGSVESTQGIYFGIIEGLNYTGQPVPIEFTSSREPNLLINSIGKLECKKGREVDVKVGERVGKYWAKQSVNNIRINLPTMGYVNVPWDKIRSIEKSDINLLEGATYGSSLEPRRLVASVTLTSKTAHITHVEDEIDVEYKPAVYNGPIAYDLDEALNIEFLEGRNDGIVYRLVLDAVESIEPRNYNYSLVTLKSGSRLSLGEDQDVSFKNDGILMLNTGEYIPWREIALIHFNDSRVLNE